MKRVFVMAGLALLLGVGCSDDDGPGDVDATTDAGPGIDAAEDDSGVKDDGAVDGAVVDPVCVDGEALCLSYDSRRFCAGGQWQQETCPAGMGCFQGACQSGACSDECNLGDVDGTRTCELYDVQSSTWVTPDPAGSMHDRSRSYLQWLRRDGLAYGGVGNARYSDPGTYANVIGLGGLGDSAIWTGTYLAAEALRLRETGAADARANVISLVETLHLWFNVSGEPGMIARFVAPSGAPHPVALYDLDCAAARGHCDVSYDGALYDYIGHISRDQYQGVMLGYALAYEALGEHDEATRELIRQDVVELLNELMILRSVPTRITYNGTAAPVMNLEMRFAVLHPDEMTDGAVDLIIDTNNADDSEMYGFQEFMPNLGLVVSQLPLLSWLNNIPRAGSGVMLASFFRVGMLVTEGVEGYEADHTALVDFYANNSDQWGNAGDWLSIATQWSYSGDCGGSYYANNIVMQPMYNLARLETDATLRAVIHDDILNGRLWAEHQGTKNSFFYFIYAGQYASADPAIGPAGASQLAGFPPPPRIKVAVNLLADLQYQPHEAGCTNQVDHSQAVDVADRVVSDFMWQRHPWGLFDAGDPTLTMPGVDYLAAYWFGRHHGFIDDDTPSHCLVWRDP